MNTEERDNRLVADKWANGQVAAAAFWTAHPLVQQYINKRISGFPEKNVLRYLKERYFVEAKQHGFSLACNKGFKEVQILQNGLVDRVTGVDISEGAIHQACALAEKTGLSDKLSFYVDDFNVLEMAAEEYDAVFSLSAVHHCKELEHLFGQISHGLKDDGLFVVNEYIGPTQFQLTDEQYRIVDTLLPLLPSKLRINVIAKSRGEHLVVDSCQRYPLDFFEKVDPSEAVRSEEILPVMERFFDIVEVKPWGGGLLHFLLNKIVGNFELGDESSTAILKLLFAMEVELETAGVLKSDFALVVAKKKG